MGKILNWILTITLVLFSWTSVANAAKQYSAAYSVHDSIITHFDIGERVKLLRALGVPSRNIQQDAIDQLIDDRLKIRAARTYGIAINEDSLESGLNSLAAAQNITADAMWEKARARGVSRQAYDDFYTSQLIWRELVQRRFRQAADPTSVDLDNAINVAAAVTQRTILLAEIALPFAERGEAATIAFAERLVRDLNNGANFEDAVKRFSRSRTAEKGGQIGWLSPERLPATIASQVIGLASGQVSQPIKIATGVIILKVVASKTYPAPCKRMYQLNTLYLISQGSQTPCLARLICKESLMNAAQRHRLPQSSVR
jgi:peptidyl-prolyl cis-trans isomerase SurA